MTNSPLYDSWLYKDGTHVNAVVYFTCYVITMRKQNRQWKSIWWVDNLLASLEWSLYRPWCLGKAVKFNYLFTHANILYLLVVTWHDVQFSCAINQPLLAHHWRVHQCLLTSRFITPSIPWGVSAPGGKILKKLLKDHNFLNNSPIFIIESSTFNIFAFQKALYTIHFNLKSCFGFGERYLTP